MKSWTIRVLSALLVLAFAAPVAAHKRKIRQLPEWCSIGRICFPIKLYVSVKEDATPKQLEALKRPLQETSEKLYHASGGFFFIRSVTIRDLKTNGGFAFSLRFKGTPNGGRNIPMGPAHWWDRTIMHELGHLKLGLWDEYRYKPTCPHCVMSLNSYTFCHEGNHKGHTKRRPACWTRLRRLFPGLPPYHQRPGTDGEHAPKIKFTVVNRGQR